MKLEDCVLEITHGMARSPILDVPEREWTEGRNKSVLPEYLYRFYCLAGYFSIDKAPRFLNDPDRLLFSFLGGLAHGIRESLDEAHELAATIRSDQGKGYSPFKKMRGEQWDHEADTRQRRSFRYLIVSLASAMDQFAEVVSIFFHGDIEGLTVGRASFAQLRGFARGPFVPGGMIVSPMEAHFQELHNVLVEELEVEGDEQHWFELLHLYRNKLAHLGSPMFPIVSFHDRKGEFYSFTPNRWPLFHQSEIRPAGEVQEEQDTIQKYAEECYIHQDIVQYSEGVLHRVQHLIDRGFQVLCAAYNDFKDFDLKESALRSLRRKRQHYSFRRFPD